MPRQKTILHTVLPVEATDGNNAHEFQIRIRIQNSTIGRRQQHIIPTTSVEEQHLQTKDGGRTRRRRRKTMKRSTLTIDHRDKTRGLGIPFMSRYIENDYNLMTNTTTDIISKGDYINDNISKPSTATTNPPLRVRSLTGTVDDESTSKGADTFMVVTTS